MDSIFWQDLPVKLMLVWITCLSSSLALKLVLFQPQPPKCWAARFQPAVISVLISNTDLCWLIWCAVKWCIHHSSGMQQGQENPVFMLLSWPFLSAFSYLWCFLIMYCIIILWGTFLRHKYHTEPSPFLYIPGVEWICMVIIHISNYFSNNIHCYKKLAYWNFLQFHPINVL